MLVLLLEIDKISDWAKWVCGFDTLSVGWSCAGLFYKRIWFFINLFWDFGGYSRGLCVPGLYSFNFTMRVYGSEYDSRSRVNYGLVKDL